MKNENTIISFLANTSISAMGYKINIGVKIDKIITLSYFRFFKKLYKRRKYIEQVNEYRNALGWIKNKELKERKLEMDHIEFEVFGLTLIDEKESKNLVKLIAN